MFQSWQAVHYCHITVTGGAERKQVGEIKGGRFPDSLK